MSITFNNHTITHGWEGLVGFPLGSTYQAVITINNVSSEAVSFPKIQMGCLAQYSSYSYGYSIVIENLPIIR